MQLNVREIIPYDPPVDLSPVTVAKSQPASDLQLVTSPPKDRPSPEDLSRCSRMLGGVLVTLLTVLAVVSPKLAASASRITSAPATPTSPPAQNTGNITTRAQAGPPQTSTMNNARAATLLPIPSISGTLIMRTLDPMRLEQFLATLPTRWRSAMTIIREGTNERQDNSAPTFALVLLPQPKPKDHARMLRALTEAAASFSAQPPSATNPTAGPASANPTAPKTTAPQNLKFSPQSQLAVLTGFHCSDTFALARLAQRLLDNPRYRTGAAAAGITAMEIGVNNYEEYHLLWITNLSVAGAEPAYSFLIAALNSLPKQQSALLTVGNLSVGNLTDGHLTVGLSTIARLKIEPYRFIDHNHVTTSKRSATPSAPQPERLLPAEWWISWFSARARILQDNRHNSPAFTASSDTSPNAFIPNAVDSAASVINPQQLAPRIANLIAHIRQQGLLLPSQKIGVAVTNPITGKSIGYNLDEKMQIASIAKLYIGALIMHQRAAGKISYNRDMARKLRLMLQKSDNVATNYLLKQLGGPQNAQKLLATHYPDLAANVSITNFIPLPSGAEYKNTASPAAIGAIMAALWRGDRIPYSDELMQIAAFPGLSRLAPPGAPWLPPNTQASNKTGTTNQAFNDTATLVWPTSNGRFQVAIVTVLIEGEPEISRITGLFDRSKNRLAMQRIMSGIGPGE